MKIKSFLLATAAILLGCVSLSAQTPEEIIQKMDEQMTRMETEGYTMDLIIKMPLIGEIRTHNLIAGEKLKSTASAKDKTTTMWTEKNTQWEYDQETGVVTITTKENSSSSSDSVDSNMKAFKGITNGYKVVLQKETADAWYFLCKKLPSNKDKDDPARMDLAVAKATYLPLYLRAKKSIVSVGIENLTLGVSEQEVTFNPDDYPGVKIVDNRK